MTRTIADALRDEGRAEGRAEGAVETARAILRKALEHQFRELPEAVTRKIEETTDLERLQTAVLQALRLEKLEDLQL